MTSKVSLLVLAAMGPPQLKSHSTPPTTRPVHHPEGNTFVWFATYSSANTHRDRWLLKIFRDPTARRLKLIHPSITDSDASRLRPPSFATATYGCATIIVRIGAGVSSDSWSGCSRRDGKGVDRVQGALLVSPNVVSSPSSSSSLSTPLTHTEKRAPSLLQRTFATAAPTTGRLGPSPRSPPSPTTAQTATVGV
jgi:hypothetical protein